MAGLTGRLADQLTGRLAGPGLRALATQGLTLQRHPGARRQALLAEHRVDVVLDVGAARGGYASELRSFGYDGRIVSFEPLAAAYGDLVSAAHSDARWSAVHTALGAEAGEATINIASNSDSSSLLPMAPAHTDAAPHVGYVGAEQVRVQRLDDVAAPYLVDAGGVFLKIDTQGFERAVLAGGPDTLRRCVGLQLEMSLTTLYDGGMLVDEAVSWAYAQGFELMTVGQGFTSPTGRMLQLDGVFFRVAPAPDTAHHAPDTAHDAAHDADAAPKDPR